MVDLSGKTKSWLNYGLMGLLILVAVGVLGWFFAIKPVLAMQEKKRFEKAAASLEQLADEIQAKIGKADEVVKEENCGRAHLKNDRGPLHCDTKVSLIYNSKAAFDANTVLESVSVLSHEPLREGPLADGLKFVDTGKSLPQVIYQSITDFEGLSCALSYEYSSEQKTLIIVSSCGEPALTEHFPLRN